MGLVLGAGIWSNDGWDGKIPEDQTLSQFESIEIAPKPLLFSPSLDSLEKKKEKKTKNKNKKQSQKQ